MIIRAIVNGVISMCTLLGLVYLFDVDANTLCMGFITGYVLCLARSLFDD